jgi:hypothetical protein
MVRTLVRTLVRTHFHHSCPPLARNLPAFAFSSKKSWGQCRFHHPCPQLARNLPGSCPHSNPLVMLGRHSRFHHPCPQLARNLPATCPGVARTRTRLSLTVDIRASATLARHLPGTCPHPRFRSFAFCFALPPLLPATRPPLARNLPRSAHQLKFHSAFERSTARVIYKDDWGTQRPAIMKRNGWTTCPSEVLIRRVSVRRNRQKKKTGGVWIRTHVRRNESVFLPWQYATPLREDVQVRRTT